MATAKSSAKTAKETANVAIEDAVNVGKENMDKIMKAQTDAAEQFVSAGRERMDAAMKSFETFGSFGRENFDAWVQASNSAAKLFENMNAEHLAFTKAQVDDTVAAAKAMMGAKTLQELYDLQNDYMKSSMDAMMQQSTKLGEMSTKLSKETFEPLNERFQQTVDKMMRPVAA
ncbi:phasin family protein [Marinibaculum pumilum]|uniref:Phasin family protein n=1 Tax=Marinibaculum pumilum TaxID=1766165 RepID=A0ABV7KZ50_9PROT